MSADLFQKSLNFLKEIGIRVQFEDVDDVSFLPGLLIRDGGIIVDEGKLKHAGDILHEAAHIAVVPGPERPFLQGSSLQHRPNAAAEEMMAIAWSYAACRHLNIDPRYVFHAEGYHGDSENIVTSFDEGRYFGVPLLEWLGMTNSRRDQPTTYPAMIKWVRD